MDIMEDTELRHNDPSMRAALLENVHGSCCFSYAGKQTLVYPC